MREDIKERIELIRAGKVPEGYKKTKLGIIHKDWQKVYLKDIFERCERKNDIGNENVLTISAQDGLISQGDFFDKEIAGADKTGYWLLKKGEFAYNKSYSKGYPYGAIKRLDLYEEGIVSPLYMCFKARQNINTDFYVHYFENGMLNREIKSFAQEGARNHGLLNIAISDFYNMNIYIPNDTEREATGNILNKYDRKVKLVSGLISEKKQEEQWLLTKLLKENEATYKTIELGKIAIKVNEKNSFYKYTQVLSNSARNGVILQEEQFTKDIANNNKIDGYYVIHPNEFVYNPRISVSAPCGPININNTGITGVMSPLYTIFKVIDENINLKYLGYYFKSAFWHKYMKSVANYGARYDRMNISQHDFFKMPIFLPDSDIQKRIVDMMQVCEKEIELLKKKLELIRQEKKAMMQLLLTGIVRVSEV